MLRARNSACFSLKIPALLFLQIVCLNYVNGAIKIVPPPWANSQLNPCASQPGGWQLLFWPPDGKCYKIFQVGYPCPEGMELSPASSAKGEQLSAECKCPPKTAQFPKNNKCYDLFGIGPCEIGYYFAPDTDYKTNSTSKRQWGVCKQNKICPDSDYVFWPKDGKCYQKFTRGPCPKGQLLVDNNNTDKIASCKCNKHKELRDFRFDDGRCYQHFTRGPCWEKGHLFLPDRTCGCHNFLPNYHEETGKCYELDTIGPCSRGELFRPLPSTFRGQCQCKPHYIRYRHSPNSCYRPYTRGPCPLDHILVNSTHCLPQPCPRGHLYFPSDQSCHRIGSRGPCSANSVVAYDFATRISLDGLSYNGVCACAKEKCQETCDRSVGVARYAGACHKLYARGACPAGAWLVPKRRGKDEKLYEEGVRELEGECECVPGHIRRVRTIGEVSLSECITPVGFIAEYLTMNYTKSG